MLAGSGKQAAAVELMTIAGTSDDEMVPLPPPLASGVRRQKSPIRALKDEPLNTRDWEGAQGAKTTTEGTRLGGGMTVSERKEIAVAADLPADDSAAEGRRGPPLPAPRRISIAYVPGRSAAGIDKMAAAPFGWGIIVQLNVKAYVATSAHMAGTGATSGGEDVRIAVTTPPPVPDSVGVPPATRAAGERTRVEGAMAAMARGGRSASEKPDDRVLTTPPPRLSGARRTMSRATAWPITSAHSSDEPRGSKQDALSIAAALLPPPAEAAAEGEAMSRGATTPRIEQASPPPL